MIDIGIPVLSFLHMDPEQKIFLKMNTGLLNFIRSASQQFKQPAVHFLRTLKPAFAVQQKIQEDRIVPDDRKIQ